MAFKREGGGSWDEGGFRLNYGESGPEKGGHKKTLRWERRIDSNGKNFG